MRRIQNFVKLGKLTRWQTTNDHGCYNECILRVPFCLDVFVATGDQSHKGSKAQVSRRDFNILASLSLTTGFRYFFLT